MQLLRIGAAASLAMGLAACGNPTIQVQKADGPDRDGRAKYYFYASELGFEHLKSKGKDAAGKDIDGQDRPETIAVRVAPVPDKSRLYYLKGTSYTEGWGIQTKLKTTYLDDNRDLLSTVGTEVVDKRTDIINAVGGALVAAAPFLVLGGPGIGVPVGKGGTPVTNVELPDRISMPWLLRTAKADFVAAAAGGKTAGCTVTYEKKKAFDDATTALQAKPNDAALAAALAKAKAAFDSEVSRDKATGGSIGAAITCPVSYIGDADAGDWSLGAVPAATPNRMVVAEIAFDSVRQSAFPRSEFDAMTPGDVTMLYHSACRAGTITINGVGSTDTKPLVMKFTIADPDWVETTGLLYNGTVTLHQPCGADAGNESGSPTDPLGYGKAFLDQFKAVRDAFGKKTKTQ